MIKNEHEKLKISELTPTDQFKGWLHNRELARKLGKQADPRVTHLLRRCLAHNPRSAADAIDKCKATLTLAEMRMTLDDEFPRWEFVAPQDAVILETEVLSRKPLTVHKDVLTRGVTLITGSSDETMLNFCAHLINQLKNQRV